MRLDKVLVAFDLDDTLYKEADYVDAVFRSVAGGDDGLYRRLKEVGRPYDAFAVLAGEVREQAIALYRSGKVALADTEGAVDAIGQLRSKGAVIAIVTDGWSRRQRGKIDSLGLAALVDYVMISEEIGSEKISGAAFERLEKITPDAVGRFYVGDNPAKDFIAANRRGWTTVMIADDGRNIHSQLQPCQAVGMKARFTVNSLKEAVELISSVNLQSL